MAASVRSRCLWICGVASVSAVVAAIAVPNLLPYGHDARTLGRITAAIRDAELLHFSRDGTFVSVSPCPAPTRADSFWTQVAAPCGEKLRELGVSPWSDWVARYPRIDCVFSVTTREDASGRLDFLAVAHCAGPPARVWHSTRTAPPRLVRDEIED